MKEEILGAFLRVMPLLKDILQQDIQVTVADTTEFLYNRPGDTIDTKIKVGSKIPVNDLLYKTIKEGKSYSSTVPKEVFGIPFRGTTYPIKDSHGNVVGGIGIGRSLDEQYKVEESAESLFSSLEESNASIQEISAGSDKLLNIIDNIVEATKQTEKQNVFGQCDVCHVAGNLVGEGCNEPDDKIEYEDISDY
jgi:hypothetical protein